MNNKDNTIKKMTDFIVKYKISKHKLAKHMGISPYTLKMKLLGKSPYHFLENDIVSLREAIHLLAKEAIEAVTVFD